MFSLATINRMNAAVETRRRKDRERAAAKRAGVKLRKQEAEKGAAIIRYWKDQ